MFFSFDGLDGAGKTTQIALFVEWLESLGHQVVSCRDPGSTWLGEQLRQILLDRGSGPISRSAETFLYMAARAQLVDEVIRPALQAGKAVVSDRFLLANVVYQGHAADGDPEGLWQVGRLATGGLEPDLTFVLDVPVEVADARMGREPDRMEARGSEYRRRVREGFLFEARRRPDRIHLVDSTQEIGRIAAEIRQRAGTILAGGASQSLAGGSGGL